MRLGSSGTGRGLLVALLAGSLVFLVSCGGAVEGGGGDPGRDGGNGRAEDSAETGRELADAEETVTEESTPEETALEETLSEETFAEETLVEQTDVADGAPVSEAAVEQMAEMSITSAAVQSRWSGQIQGQVYDQAFSLPIEITLGQPKPFENNPIGVYVGAGDMSQIGSLSLHSANEFATAGGSTLGQAATLQYFAVTVQGPQITATLTDEHAAEAAMINQFTGPTVAAQNAPPGPIQELYQQIGMSTGSVEPFAVVRGAELVMATDGATLAEGTTMTGSFRAYGTGIIYPSQNVPYVAQFSATRVG